MSDSFIDGTSAAYLEELERQFEKDPSAVPRSWASYLNALGSTSPDALSEGFVNYQKGQAPALAYPSAAGAALSHQTIQESMRLMLLVRAYQVNGHLKSKLDPIGLDNREIPIELDPALYGFTEADLDREFFIGTWRMKGFLSEDRPVRKLRDILQRLEESYCGSIGYEYMHVPHRDRCNWMRERIETAEKRTYSKKRKTRILDRLAWSTMFENFLSTKYTAAKRFGLEGGESLIPGMKAMIDKAAELGVESVVIGMPHRGRLNVLGNVVRKPLSHIFSEFQGGVRPNKDGGYTGSGDVKYHLGTSYDRPTHSGKPIHLSLVANPSHLEAVNTVVLGKVRAKQFYLGDDNREKVMPIILHGDGSFAGQGIVMETLDMSGLPDYSVGGTIHIVVNNQVAFTTDSKTTRSTEYCTGVAKGMDIPVFHVNGDDAEAVTHVFELAMEWRQAWKCDVVIDLVCYRKHGHNEIDEPSFTQPVMYDAIRRHKDAHTQYKANLIAEGTMSGEEIDNLHKTIDDTLKAAFEEAKDVSAQKRDWLTSYWAGFKSPDQLSKVRSTGIPRDTLMSLGDRITHVPEDIKMHRGVKKVYDTRRKMFQNGEPIDWATAEALAFGSLLLEGNHVRLSGQDVERGTFGHRHQVIHDQKTYGKDYIPLANLYKGQPPGMFTISNSSLCEFGELGYELGYSMENPNSLVCWEAQFGDFANGAQVIIDQFISSGEAKWLRQSGLVLLLPHGYDGQGPEHSSARLERYLQMSDEDPNTVPDLNRETRMQIQSCNWQVVNITTPANYFHCLRRQLHREFRKPLIVMSPKNLLRHPDAKSAIEEFDDIESNDHQGSRFRRLIMDESATDRNLDPADKEPGIRKVVFCSGKIYYELAAERAKLGLQKDIAICRVEQLSPFPFDLCARELRRYPNAKVQWCQEEPMNMGAWTYVLPRFFPIMKACGKSIEHEFSYAGRPTSAATATGFGEVHAAEQSSVIEQAMKLD